MRREDLRIISGGQTGVDQAALDAAIEAEVPHGGWCPKGRRSEAGAIPLKYQLQEAPGSSYMIRTIMNVKAADVTLLLFWEELTGGTLRTRSTCITLKKPYYEVRLDARPGVLAADLHQCIAPVILAAVMRKRATEPMVPFVLNVAGPRASKDPGVSSRAGVYMRALIAELLK